MVFRPERHIRRQQPAGTQQADHDRPEPGRVHLLIGSLFIMGYHVILVTIALHCDTSERLSSRILRVAW